MIEAFQTLVGRPGKRQAAVRCESRADARAGALFTIRQRDHLGPTAALEAGQPVFPVSVLPGRSLSNGSSILAGLRHHPYRPAPIGEYVRLVRVAASERGIESGLWLFPMSAHETFDMRLPDSAQRHAWL